MVTLLLPRHNRRHKSARMEQKNKNKLTSDCTVSVLYPVRLIASMTFRNQQTSRNKCWETSHVLEFIKNDTTVRDTNLSADRVRTLPTLSLMKSFYFKNNKLKHLSSTEWLAWNIEFDFTPFFFCNFHLNLNYKI